MQTRSISRELALLVLGQIPEGTIAKLKTSDFENLLNQAIDTLMQHCQEGLDGCALTLDNANQQLLESELQESAQNSIIRVREHLKSCLTDIERVLNCLSSTLEFPRLLILGEQEEIRTGAMQRISLVRDDNLVIDSRLNEAMEGWKLKRLPRIDRDILRLAVVDLVNLQTPPAIACNEAVELANRYSDEQGRRMINGILRRLQNSFQLI